MDFSRPDNARKINRLKVLSTLRNRPSSKAGLARLLSINKVSIGEIIDSLLEEGLIEEAGKESIPSGRPAMLYAVKGSSGKVFSIELKSRSISVSVSDTLGRIMRYERMPRTDSWKEDLNDTVSGLRGSDTAKVYGAAVVASETEELPSFPDFPTVRIPFSMAEATSEMSRLGGLTSFLFLSWSDSFDACYITHSGPIHLPTLPHMRVSKEGLCTCGGTGCLEAAASGSVLKRKCGASSFRELLSSPQNNAVIRAAVKTVAYALSEAIQAIGASSVILTGEMSPMDDSFYAFMQEIVSSLLPPGRKDVVIYGSVSGEKGAREGAAIAALDMFFYNTELLLKLNAIESL